MGISFEQVSYIIDNKTILNKISGHFPDKKVTCLIGPSGSGKTTLLKLCNGLNSPSSGKIFVHDKKIWDMSPVELRRSVGIVLQHAPMITGTVYDNLALPLQLQKKTLHPDEAHTLLQEVGLPDLLKQEAKDLSGGQKQRVAIARTLVNKPNILLLDEITASLDREAATEIEQLLLQINKKFGTTMIWITHDLHQAKRVGDYMWMLADGKLIETGEIDVLHSPKSTELQHFLKGDTT